MPDDSNYFALRCFSPSAKERVGLAYSDNPPPTTWLTGRPLKLGLESPLHYDWNALSEGGARLAYYSTGPVLMRADLLAALGRCGVDNLEVFPAVIHSPAGDPDCLDYSAVNIIGLVEALDTSRAVTAPTPNSGPLIDQDILSLAIDEERAHGLPIFRLAECVSAVLIHRRVAKFLEGEGGFGLTFQLPSEFSG